MSKKLANAKKGVGGIGWVKGVDMTVPCTPFILCALFSVCAPFTINVPFTVLGSCLMMDFLFQITFDGLFISDNIYFIKLFKIISLRYMHEYEFCIEIFVSDTDDF